MSDEKGVLAGSPADLFENFDAGEAQMAADAAPFRAKPQPIGGSRRGIPNKRTVQLRELYLKMGLPHPVLTMGAVLRLGIDGLAKELQCGLLDAADLYRKIAADVAPYIEGKQPTRVLVDASERLPVLIVGEMTAAQGEVARAREEGALAIDDDVEPAMVAFERNQALKAASRDASHGLPSHGGANALKER